MNKLLVRQIKKYLKNSASSEDIPELFNAISESYDHYDKDRKMLERSIELSSNEMIALNNKLRKESEESSKTIFEILKESLSLLNDENEKINNPQGLTLEDIADLLKNEIVKRKVAEHKIKQREVHLRTSQEIAHIGSWEVKIDTTNGLKLIPVYWSDETFRIIGYEPGDLEMNTDIFFSRIHPDDVQMINDALANTIEKGVAYNIEHRIIQPDGKEKFVHGCGEIIYDSHTRQPLRIMGTIQDITVRKKAEEKFMQTSKELKTLFENMQEVYFSVDMTTYQLIQISQACEIVYGYTVENFLKNSNLWLEVILDEDKHIVEGNYPVMGAGNPFRQTYRTRHTDGSIRWLTTYIRPALNSDGNLIRIDGITSDITKSKESEIALRNSERKFRSLIENSSDVITVLNEKQEIIYASDSIYRITGFMPEETVTTKSLDFVHPDDRDAAQKCWSKLITTANHTEHFTYRRLKKDGNYIWVESIITNLLQDPVLKGIVINFRDITDRIKYEQELKAANKELLKSNKELDKFVYSVSHDLRAPLSSVLGLVEYSETETTDESMLETLGLIKNSINKLDGFVIDILDYSRNSRMEPQKVLINFKELLDDITTNLKFMSKGKGDVDLRIDVECDAILYSDKTRLSIILNNLISNGIRYYNPNMPEPFVEVIIKPNDNGVEIIVRDNGIGIDGKNHDKVFDMFYRISQKSVGSGLGLYIVKEAVERLHGSITLYSEKNKGSEFKIILPNI